jgi:hypothetical protein
VRLKEFPKEQVAKLFSLHPGKMHGSETKKNYQEKVRRKKKCTVQLMKGKKLNEKKSYGSALKKN